MSEDELNKAISPLKFENSAKILKPLELPFSLDTDPQIGQMRESLGLLELGHQSGRGIAEYSHYLGFEIEEDFIDYISGKRVVDAGSGFGALAVEAYLRGIDAEIYSINPMLASPGFRNRQVAELYREYAQPEGSPFTTDQIDNAVTHHDKFAFARLAENLPFPDESIDLILDSWAISYYASEMGSERYEASIREMMRILKPEGKIRIAQDYLHGNFGNLRQVNRKPGLQENTIKKMGLNYRLIPPPNPSSESQLIIEITK